MLDHYLDQLDSSNPEERKKAVIALGKSGDPAALKPLAQVYKTDPSPEVRELALKAGRYLKKETDGLPPPERIERKEETPYTSFIPPVEADVAPRDVDRAKGYVEQALDMHVRGQDDKARDLLVKALAINPRLRKDNYTASMAATITGMDADEAIAELVTEGAATGGKEKPKRGSRDVSDTDTVSWGDAMIDLALYGLVTAGGLVAVILFAFQGFQVMMNSALLSGSSSANLPTNFSQVMNASQLSLIIGAIVIGVISAIGLLVQLGVIHFSAVSILGGDGNLTNLIHKMVPVQIVIGILSFVGGILFLIYIGSVAATATESELEGIGSLPSTVSSLWSLGIFIYVSYLIGNIYKFGWFRGCIAQIIATVLQVVLFVCIGCSFFSLLGTMFGGTSSFQ